MKADEFEKRLSSQPLKEVPGEWRVEILAAARSAQPAPHALRVTHQSFLSTLNHQLSTLLWPHPKAWAALATVWLFIFILNFATRDQGPVVAVKSAPPSPEMAAELRQQHAMLAELIGPTELRVADRRPLFLPKPRSGRSEILGA